MRLVQMNLIVHNMVEIVVLQVTVATNLQEKVRIKEVRAACLPLNFICERF